MSLYICDVSFPLAVVGLFDEPFHTLWQVTLKVGLVGWWLCGAVCLCLRENAKM